MPVLKVFEKKEKKSFKLAIKKSIIKKLGLKYSSKNDSKNQENPFLILGYGINAYFDLMQLLVYMFLMITIFCIPIYFIYSNTLVQFLHYDSNYFLNRFSLGNMGGSTVVCK